MDHVNCTNFSSAHPLQDQVNPGDFVINIFMTLFATIEILTLTTNGVLLLALICSTRQGSKQPDSNQTKNSTLTKMLMTSLACSDTMLGLFMMSLQLHELSNQGKWTLGSTLCALRIHVNNFLCASSITHIFCMSVDRYVAVCKPLLHRQLTRTTGYVMLSLSWGVPFVLIFIPDMVIHEYSADSEQCLTYTINCGSIYHTPAIVTFYTIVFYVPYIATYILYLVILYEVRQFQKRKVKYAATPSRHITIAAPKVGSSYESQLGAHSDVELRIFRQNDTSVVVRPTETLTLEYSTIHTEFQWRRIKVTEESPVLLRDVGCNLQTRQCATPGQGHAKNVDGNIANKGVDCSSVATSAEQMSKCLRRKRTENRPVQPTELVRAPASSPAIRNLKAFRTIGYVMVSFTLCWLPSWLSVGVFTSMQIFMPIWLLWTMTLVAYVSSALNPVLYCCNRSIKRAVVALFKVNTH